MFGRTNIGPVKNGLNTDRLTCCGGWFDTQTMKTAVGDALRRLIVQELSESRGGRPGLSVLTSPLDSVDVKLY